MSIPARCHTAFALALALMLFPIIGAAAPVLPATVSGVAGAVIKETAIGLMMWLWLSVIVVLIGGELNAEIEHQTARDTTIGHEKTLGMRGAVMADTISGPTVCRKNGRSCMFSIITAWNPLAASILASLTACSMMSPIGADE